MGHISCHGNQSYYLTGTKNNIFGSPPPSCGCFMPNIKSFGHTASEEMSFEIVDDGRRQTDGRTDGYLPILISSPLSLRLR